VFCAGDRCSHIAYDRFGLRIAEHVAGGAIIEISKRPQYLGELHRPRLALAELMQ